MRRETVGALRRGVRMVGITGVALAIAAATSAQGPRQGLPPLVPESLVGSVSFDLYCASCHGRFGRGDGPTAAALKGRPADLTTLARSNRGVFPRERVLAFVEGSARAAGHGSPEMPVWGPTLRALDASDARVTVRLQNLVAFVESIQQGPAAPPVASAADGAALYRAYCANCHGGAGRGDGPMGAQLRRQPPNLTTFAVRNGGVFPAERVRQVIDGSGIAAHGDRDMPVWGAVFKRSSGGDEAGRIDAIVRFLEGLQQRPA
jgi:mono/diheme cytochrome c family protein